MEYTIIWKEHFVVSPKEDRYVTTKREYDDEDATREPVRGYKNLRITQGHVHSVDGKYWTDKTTGKQHRIVVHSFTNGQDTHSMWVGPSLLA